MILKPKKIILHYSKTKDSKTVSWDDIQLYHESYAYKGNIISEDEAMAAIDQGINNHNIKLPWDETGYHAGSELINERYQILFGRSWLKKGAHCRAKNMNNKSFGFVFVGDYDLVSPPVEMWNLGVKFIDMILKIYNLTPDDVKGHREYDPSKTCPGMLFSLDKFRDDLKNEKFS